MANIDKIKEQGNQAAPLLTELQDNETQNKLFLSCSSFQGGPNIDSVRIEKLKGRENSLDVLKRLKNKTLKIEDLTAELQIGYNGTVLKNAGYAKYTDIPGYQQELTLGFLAYKIATDATLAYVAFYLTLTYSTGDLDVQVYVYKTDDLVSHNVTAQFID